MSRLITLLRRGSCDFTDKGELTRENCKKPPPYNTGVMALVVFWEVSFFCQKAHHWPWRGCKRLSKFSELTPSLPKCGGLTSNYYLKKATCHRTRQVMWQSFFFPFFFAILSCLKLCREVRWHNFTQLILPSKGSRRNSSDKSAWSFGRRTLYLFTYVCQYDKMIRTSKHPHVWGLNYFSSWCIRKVQGNLFGNENWIILLSLKLHGKLM